MRFRLRTDFLTYARDQIRGGLWYKPSWWEAVQRVPPTGFVPRIKKRDVPTVRFLEDRLIREFDSRNPMLAQFDNKERNSKVRVPGFSGPPPSIAAQFAQKQVEFMKANMSEAEAYQQAQLWMLENGKKVFYPQIRPNLPIALQQELEKDAQLSSDNNSSDNANTSNTGSESGIQGKVKSILYQQTRLLRTVLSMKTGGTTGSSAGATNRYRSFLEKKDINAIRRRKLTSDPKLPSLKPVTEAAVVAAVQASTNSNTKSANNNVKGGNKKGKSAAITAGEQEKEEASLLSTVLAEEKRLNDDTSVNNQ